MSKPKFTPGPWHLSPADDESLVISGGAWNGPRRTKGPILAVLQNRDSVWLGEDVEPEESAKIANAHLIAAAPDLYKALEAAIATIENLLAETIHSDEGYDRALERTTQPMKELLAKARGEGR